MVFSKGNASLRHLLILLYLLIVILLVCLLVRERQSDEPPFSLSQASVGHQHGSVMLSLSGEAFHSEVRGVLAKSLVNEESLLWQLLAGVPAKAVDVKNNLALVSCYAKKLVSVELHDGNRPELLGSIELPETIRQVKIVGDQALVGLQRHAGFSLVDLSDPRALRLVKNYPLAGFVTSMVANQSIVYYTDIYQGVGRFDLSVENPVPEPLVPLDSPWRIALQGNRMAVGTMKGTVHLFNVTQRGLLSKAGELNFPGNVRGVAFVNNSLVVTDSDDTLHVLDLSSWPRLSRLAHLKLPGSPMLLERLPGQASLAVGLVAGGIALVDVSQPAVPRLSGALKIPSTFVAILPLAKQVLGVNQDGVKSFSLDKISDGEYSSMAIEATMEQNHYQLQPWNGHVYGYGESLVVDLGELPSTEVSSSSRFMTIVENAGVSLFEQRESGQVQRAGSLIRVAGARDARFLDNHLYVVHQSGLRVFSGTRPEELAVIGNLTLPGGPFLLEILDSGYLLIATRDDGMLVVDVNNPQQPRQVASLAPPPHLQSNNTLQDVLIIGQRAYLSQGAGGVHVVDISSPSQPELLQIIDVPGLAKKMVLYDNLLLVAASREGLFMIDVKDRNEALPVGTLPTPLRIDDFAVVNDGLICSSHPGGTMKLPLPQRMKNLHTINQGEMRADVETFEKGQYAYLYDEKQFKQVKVGAQ